MHPQNFSCLILSSTKLSVLCKNIFNLTNLTYHNLLFMAEEVAVIAHTKTNFLDSILKHVVSSGID